MQSLTDVPLFYIMGTDKAIKTKVKVFLSEVNAPISPLS